MSVKRCEECLTVPDETGACPRHPHARLIWMSDEAAADELATLAGLRADRRRTRRWLITGALLAVAFVLTAATKAIQLWIVLLLAALWVGLHWVPAIMLSRGWRAQTGRDSLPVWVLALLGAVLGGAMSVSLIASGAVPMSGMHFPLRAFIVGPALIWMLGGVAMMWPSKPPAEEPVVSPPTTTPLPELAQQDTEPRKARRPTGQLTR